MSRSPVRLLSTICASAILLASACATTGGAAPPASAIAAAAPVKLVGTRWKLPAAAGRLDGRTIEFKHASSRYQGVLTDLGHRLPTTLGARPGIVFMDLIPSRQADSFDGLEYPPGEDPREIVCSIAADHRTMKCNNEVNVWKRIDDGALAATRLRVTP